MVQDLLFFFVFLFFRLNMPKNLEEQVKCTVVDCKKKKKKGGAWLGDKKSSFTVFIFL